MPLRTIWRPWKWASVVLSGGLLAGCSTSEKKLSYIGDADLEHYKDVVTSIDYPTVNQETPDEVSYSDEPRRIRKPRKDEVWNLGLDEAVHTALANNEVIRDNGQFLSPSNRLLTNPHPDNVEMAERALNKGRICLKNAFPNDRLLTLLITHLDYGINQSRSQSTDHRNPT